MIRLIGILLLMTLWVVDATSQGVVSGGAPTIITRARIIEGDTVPHVQLPEVVSVARRKWKSRRAAQRYDRLVYNVRKVLPIARLAAQRIAIIQDSAQHIQDKKLRKKYIDNVEKQLFAEFEKPLKKLSISQGRVLIKLIDRETGDTSYELIRLLKGRFSAFMWQGVARIFGSNLKQSYDLDGTDREIENIITLIDIGAYDHIYIKPAL